MYEQASTQHTILSHRIFHIRSRIYMHPHRRIIYVCETTLNMHISWFFDRCHATTPTPDHKNQVFQPLDAKLSVSAALAVTPHQITRPATFTQSSGQSENLDRDLRITQATIDQLQSRAATLFH